MILRRLGKTVLAALVVLFAAAALPDIYWELFYTPPKEPRAFYSPTVNDFAIIKGGVDGTLYYTPDEDGFDGDWFEEAVPFLTYRQLVSEGKLPDTLHGVAMDPKAIRDNNFTFAVKPRYVRKELIPLFPLFESQSGRVRLDMPEDYCRIADRVEFVHAARNEVIEEKSVKFTEALAEAGFAFPGKRTFGNFNTRKPFDAGVFAVDADDKVFHIIQAKGEPIVADLKIPDDLTPVYIATREMELREFYGILVGEDSRVFMISYDDYKLIELPLEGFNWRTDELSMRGDILFRTVNIIKKDEVSAFAIDRDYELIDAYSEPMETKYDRASGTVAEALFPFQIRFLTANDPYVGFHARLSGPIALILMTLSAVVAFFVYRKRGAPMKYAAPGIALAFLTGVFGLIVVAAIPDFE
ncbi:MAG: DUF4857 domain-containing protein [Ignavibacteriales bacterium]|nr:DUF4857 domain-containing protein [Ignavibacteriales bacterium]